MLLTVVLTVVGLGVVVLVVHDAVLTTLSPSTGAGPMARLLLRAAPRAPHRISRVLPPGTGVLSGAVLLWTALMWLGWTLVLGAREGAVVSSSTGEPASLAGRFYFAGYSLLTLGVGDYAPVGAWAQVMTVVAAFTGLFVVTLAVTYQMNVVSAVVGQRSLASRVRALGVDGHDVASRWEGVEGGREMLQERFTTLADDLAELTEQHLAYPVLHRFADTSPARSAVVAVAALDQALQVLASTRPGGAATAPEQVLSQTIDAYVLLVTSTGAGPRSTGPAGGSGHRSRLHQPLSQAHQEEPGDREPS